MRPLSNTFSDSSALAPLCDSSGDLSPKNRQSRYDGTSASGRTDRRPNSRLEDDPSGLPLQLDVLPRSNADDRRGLHRPSEVQVTKITGERVFAGLSRDK